MELGSKPTLNFYDLAVSISELYTDDACSLDKLPGPIGISRRKIYYLRDAGHLIRARLLSREAADKIGWTKLQIVARHVLTKEDGADTTDEEWLKFLEIARNATARNLPDALKEQNAVQRRLVAFHLTKSEQIALRELLLTFGAQQGPSGLSGKEAALMKIIEVAKSSFAQSSPTEHLPPFASLSVI